MSQKKPIATNVAVWLATGLGISDCTAQHFTYKLRAPLPPKNKGDVHFNASATGAENPS